jgi:hypothetical protein
MSGISDMHHETKINGQALRLSNRFGLISLMGLIAIGFLMACLQGPWDYTPNDPPLFRGIWAQAYVVAGRPVTDVCFEKLLALDEENTPAFAFYDSASVGIEGRFSKGGQTLALSPKANKPNCFTGDPATLAMLGEAYTLHARFVWDSSGTSVVSTLTATSRITDSFAVKKTAMAPSVAFIGGFGAGGSLFTPENISKLPPKILAQFQTEFSSEIEELQSIQKDSVKLVAFFKADSKPPSPGVRMTNRLIQLLQNDQRPFTDTNSLFYISNRDLNTLSLTFTTVRGPGVKGVLIVQRWDTTASRIINAFQGFFGQKPDSASFYYPGDIHRLELFPDGENKEKGFNFLDSIGIVNGWLFIGRNRLYFYGCDTNYATYLSTNTQAGESPEDNPKVKPYTNVRGGRGFLAALAVDSFDLLIKADPADQPYSLLETRAKVCSKEGWFNSRDCIDYYREWCTAKQWKTKACNVDAIRACLEVNWRADTLGGMCDSMSVYAQTDSAKTAKEEAQRRFCIEHNYSDSAFDCNAVKAECESPTGRNDCKEMLWKTCDLRDWNLAALPACRNGEVTYCRDAKPNAPSLCKAAEKLCTENPKPSSCP